jgi:hypothetical protein
MRKPKNLERIPIPIGMRSKRFPGFHENALQVFTTGAAARRFPARPRRGRGVAFQQKIVRKRSGEEETS